MILNSEAFPAHAGMNRAATARTQAARGVPRTRGDEPAAPRGRLSSAKRSPHTRDEPMTVSLSALVAQRSPAHAG